MRILNRHLSVLLLALTISTPTLAEDPSQSGDGVQVGKSSVWSKIVPSQMIEGQSAQQYAALKEQVRSKGKLAPDNDPQLQRLRKIAKRIIPFVAKWNSRATNWEWEVNLIDAPDINAFCMPGGKIAFYTGILEKLNLTDDEAAMVMGHEIAHALREHGRKRVAQGTAVNVGAALASRALGLGDTMQMVLGKGAELTILKFSRSDETEADLVGMDIAARAGFNPNAGVTLWQKMGAANGGGPPQWLSTHPSGNNRIAEMQKHMHEAMPLYEKAQKK